jgi:membrane protein DedA with SNARE-associated domain
MDTRLIIGSGVALFLAPWLHEDAAIVTGGLLVIERGLPVSVALISLVSGVVASDMAIYGLGAVARRWSWLRRRLVGERVERARRALGSHLALSVALCHVMPGVLFPTFLACGWFRLPFRRFAAASAAAAAIYVPAALLVVIAFGEAVLHSYGLWAWGLVLVAVLLLSLHGSLRQVWTGLAVAADRAVSAAAAPKGERESHRGMPALVHLVRNVSRSERIPQSLYYVPLALRWLALGAHYGSLALPTLANPTIKAGGLWGESKSGLLDQVRRQYPTWVAGFVTVARSASIPESLDRALRALTSTGLDFPLVAKPDLGWQGFGVRRVDRAADLKHYLAEFPAGQTLILQRYIPYDGEAGIYYARRPGQAEGSIVGLAFRYFPYVVGDGHSTLRLLIASNPRTRFKAHYHLGAARDHLGLSAAELEDVPPAGKVVRLALVGSLRVGGLYRDAREHVTPALTARIDALAKSIDRFYFGRFDVRFATLEGLRAGQDFAIIEVTGAGSEPIQVWDPDRSILSAYRELFHFQSMMFEIAADNRARGYRPMPLFELLRMTRRYNRLLDAYPPSS